MAVAFFLAELGDKTMLTTAGLAADRGAVPVWIGSFAAMLTATALAVLAGQSLIDAACSAATLRHVGADRVRGGRRRHARRARAAS